MAIKVAIQGGRDLRIPGSNQGTGAGKRNYLTALGGAPFSGSDVVGHWRAAWVRLPTSYAGNGATAILGYDAANTAVFSGTTDTSLRIPQAGYSTVAATQRRPRINYASGSSTPAYSGGSGGSSAAANEGDWPSTQSQLPLASATPLASEAVLVIDGVMNVGSNASPSWRNFICICRNGGTPETYVAATATTANWLTNTTGRLLTQIFVAQGSSGTIRTVVGTVLEHVALVVGDFPWDTANNPSSGAAGVGRPHHDAIAALAGSGANAFKTYATLVSDMNAGTLPYSNLPSNRGQGKADVRYWYKLTNLATGLSNSGSVASVDLVPTDGGSANAAGLVDEATIAPAHWTAGAIAPTINPYVVKGIGGRGTRARTFAGTYDAVSTTALQRRWEVEATGTAVPGFDWGGSLTLSSGNWTCSDTLPEGGPYRLRVRDANLTTLEAASSGDWLVGVVVWLHGQSGIEQFAMGEPDAAPGVNRLGVAASAGVQAAMVKLNDQRGGTSSGYVRPTPGWWRVVGGTTPAVGQGLVRMANEWNVHNPGVPLIVVNMAINGVGQQNWIDNTAVPSGHASWTLMGPTTLAEPGASDGSASGVMNYYGYLMGGHADVHLMMWPTIVTTQAGRAAYTAAIDARLPNAPNAPWGIFPIWRMSVEAASYGAINYRSRCLDLVDELGSRGVLMPCFSDHLASNSGSLHPAYHSNATAGGGGSPSSDQNEVGQARIGRGLGRSVAWFYNRKIKAHGPRVIGPWFTDGTRTSIQIELGRKVRTLNAAAIAAELFWISQDGGSTWTNTGFTVALDASGTRAVLTSTGAAFNASVTRVDYARDWPFATIAQQADEATLNERRFDGLLYDNQNHRGGTNLIAQAGNPLQGINRHPATGGITSGVAVTTRGDARLVATERFAGARTVSVRLMAADGVTVLREKALAITAS
ncbi:hypothetical protein [Sandarakinorhabdus oryzae]|uniref:hypothetical protein n=1 Tax=Sandarakinorhabdus oryzae TaxID=2675220 RepID=UPI0012E20F63|nr:hypothetical protein [Sandarakinorhabdus oryzae]